MSLSLTHRVSAKKLAQSTREAPVLDAPLVLLGLGVLVQGVQAVEPELGAVLAHQALPLVLGAIPCATISISISSTGSCKKHANYTPAAKDS